MSVAKKAVAAVKEIGKAYGDWYSESKDKPITPPEAFQRDKASADKKAAEQKEMPTVKSLVGVK